MKIFMIVFMLTSLSAIASPEAEFLRPLVGDYQLKGDAGCEDVRIVHTASANGSWESIDVRYGSNFSASLLGTDGQDKFTVTKNKFKISSKEYSMMGNPFNTKKYSTTIVKDASGKLKSIKSSYGQGEPLFLKDSFSIECEN